MDTTPRHCEQALLRRPVKSNVSPRGLTEAKLIHATTSYCESRNDREYQ
ncbi:MAG TPA: hypothetical protein LFV92_03795 [Rickettsia endosymbiont of Ceroptres masudai]|nr:hypothetical protein [Rickettsia endosymbiont of Ceroptres masudai]